MWIERLNVSQIQIIGGQYSSLSDVKLLARSVVLLLLSLIEIYSHLDDHFSFSSKFMTELHLRVIIMVHQTMSHRNTPLTMYFQLWLYRV